MIGKTLSTYKLIKVIGMGGMSTVYLGKDTKTGSLAALKVLKKAYTQDEDHLKRFFSREIKTAKSLDHKNIVKLLDFGKKGDTHFLIYEYIEGLSLDRYLAEHKKLPLKKIENIILQILAALSHAHSKAIVHRDIKPQNILVDSDGLVKITDFGIAKALSSTTITQTGMFMGSPNYISPEQAEGKKTDGRSDLYSLGVVLFEMLTRKLPFSADTPWAIVHKHIYTKAPDLSSISKKVPSYLSNVVSMSLSKNPKDRISSAEEMAHIITTKSYYEPTVIKSVDSDKTKKDLNKPTKKPIVFNKKKLAIILGVSAVLIWLIVGVSFYSVGNKYYNEDKNITAAHNFKLAQIMLIPDAKNSKIKSLDHDIGQLEMFLDLGRYEIVYKNMDYIKNHFPEYTGIEALEERIVSLYPDKKEEYLTYLEKENFLEAKATLISMIGLSREADNYSQEQIVIVTKYIEANTYLDDAMELVDEKDFDNALALLDSAKKLVPNYKTLLFIYDDIKNKKDNYDTFIAKINEINQLNQNDDYINAYKQAKNFLQDDDFLSVVAQEDIDRLTDIKDSAYDIGKDVPANSVSFKAYSDSNNSYKTIKNVFDIKLYTVNFSLQSVANDNSSRMCSFSIILENNWNDPILILSADAYSHYTDSPNETAMATDRRNNPNAIVEVAVPGKVYKINRFNRNFIIKVNSRSVSEYWFENLSVTVSVQS